MPLTSQVVTVSGVGPTAAEAHVLITYDCNQLGYTLPSPNTGNQNIVPGFMYLQGNVVFTKDSQGNMHAVNPNKDGSIPI
jgi:hypothetical protein